MILFPFCKINLGLHILSKRDDGFHNIESLLLPVNDLCDVLEILPAKSDAFILSGKELDGKEEDNLVCKALRLARSKKHVPPCHIHLHKNIPSGAGLGGGSSDATHTLIGLNTVFDLHFTESDIYEMSRFLGSDCAFFSQQKAAIASEKGDVLTKVDMPIKEYELLLVVPPVLISTAKAYAGVKPINVNVPLQSLLREPIKEWREIIKNDFEKSLFPEFEILDQIKNTLYKYGAFYASLSGSGSAIFGFFESKAVFKPSDFPASSFIFQTRIGVPSAHN